MTITNYDKILSLVKEDRRFDKIEAYKIPNNVIARELHRLLTSEASTKQEVDMLLEAYKETIRIIATPESENVITGRQAMARSYVYAAAGEALP